jgi:hypothetical protein
MEGSCINWGQKEGPRKISKADAERKVKESLTKAKRKPKESWK